MYVTKFLCAEYSEREVVVCDSKQILQQLANLKATSEVAIVTATGTCRANCALYSITAVYARTACVTTTMNNFTRPYPPVNSLYKPYENL